MANEQVCEGVCGKLLTGDIKGRGDFPKPT